MKILPSILCLFFSLCALTCKKEPPIVPPDIAVDTTSQRFVVTRIDTLGDLFSLANAVDIVDENDIWVVGMFTERDTDGEILYNKNLAHWNGVKWELIAVPIEGYNHTGPSTEELGGVRVFDHSKIFVVTKHDNSTAWFDGINWTPTYVDGATISCSLWARSANEIYFVGPTGTKGNAAYYNGQSFASISTGLINPPLTDVWGDENSIYAVGYGTGADEGTETVFLSGNNSIWSVNEKYDVTTNDTTHSYFAGGMGSVYRASKNSKLWLLGGQINWQVFEVTSLKPFAVKKDFDLPYDYNAHSIRGTADNDLYVPNSVNCVIYHYNGKSWHKYEPPVNNFLLGYTTGAFFVIRNDWAAAGLLRGDVVGRAIVIIGKHL